jgi:ABC-2 type transport system permease protein
MKDEKNMENMNQTPNPEPEKTETAKAGKNRRSAADSMRFQSDLLKSSQKKRSAKPGLSARKWQYGTISVGLVIAFIAVIVMANAGISFLTNRFYLKLDMTPTSYYEISDTTRNLLENMQQEVTVHILLSENDVINSKYYNIAYEFLQKYRALSGGKISINFVDIYKNPTFINGYTDTPEEISAGSFIVESPLRYKILKLADLYKISTQVTDESTYSYQQYVSGVEADQTLASALQYVLSEDLPTVVFVTGHDEQYSDYFASLFTNSNYNYQEVNIVFNDIPRDAAIVVVGNPGSDWTNEQINRLDTYLKEENGNVIFLAGLSSTQTPLLNDWLEEWGVGVQNLMVLDSERAIGNPLGVVADILDTTVCENLEVSDTTYVLMPNSVSLELLWENSNHHSATPVLASSASSYAKSFEDFNDVKSYAYADGDEKGPFHLGILCTYSSSVSGVATGGRMLVLGSNYMIADTYLDMEQLANKDYLLEVIDYLYDGVDPLIIDTVKYTSTSMTMLSSQARTILIVLMVIPFVVLAFGIYVWLRRRHK